MAGAEDVGKRLLGGVEECGFDQILTALRLQNGAEFEPRFNFSPIDQFLHAVVEGRPQTSRPQSMQQMIELMSLASGGGKTHLLYHLSALAVLPSTYGGKQACAIIVDSDGKFSVPRLATQIQLLIRRHHPQDAMTEESLHTETRAALRHIHVFRPQSLASTIATLDSLPTYLFTPTRHFSFDRCAAFIALDSASAFYWQDRSETDDAAFLAATSAGSAPAPSAYVPLAAALKTAARTFDCPAIFTTWYLGPAQKLREGPAQRSFRPQIPALQAALRLVVHRVPVRKFPAGLGVEGAVREAGERQKAVLDGRFECFVNEWGVDERLVRSLSGGGFGFRIVPDGLMMEETERERN